VPIRIRAAAGKPREYFSLSDSAGWSPEFRRLLGLPSTSLEIKWTIIRRQPNDVPRDLKSETLWEPGEDAGTK
jgi:hypothetical protein